MMSRSKLLTVDQDGDICDDTTYQNSWGFAAMVWISLVDKYDRQIPPAAMSTDRWPLLWKEMDRLPLTWYERNTLLATYDRAIIRAADLFLLADSFDRFAAEHAKEGFACSLPAMAARMRRWAAEKPVDVCFYATSVAEDPWWVRSEDEDEGRVYNVKTDTLHFYVEPTKESTAAASPDAGDRGSRP